MFKIYVFLLSIPFALMAQTGDALFAQAYSMESIDNGLQSVSLCDDFLPDVAGNLGNIELWMLLTSGQPPSITLGVLQDNGSVNPNNATPLFNSPLETIVEDTGDNFAGYDVYHVTCPVDQSVYLSGSQRYWLQLDVPVGGYWLCQNPLVFGSTMWVFTGGEYVSTVVQLGTAYDSFFILTMPVSLERNSWGAIKASF